MSKLTAFAAAFLVAPAAFACPGAASCGACSSFGGYISSVSLGVLIGVASVGVEKLFSERRKRG